MTIKLYRDLAGCLLWMDDHKRIHNADGPAVIWTDRQLYDWFYEGKTMSFEDWCKKTGKTEEEIVILKLKYGL